ncbi:MAG: DUF945 domain-containing protein [Proteobacteria bacterium]|nr:MAG: DUF945 domain-containing protein [Pseudomonadota bacterium]
MKIRASGTFMLKKIFKIKLKLVGIVLVGLIAIQVISAYFFGVMAEKQFDYQFKQLTNSQFIKVVEYKYTRGWFVSHEHVTIELNNQGLRNLLAVLPVKSAESQAASIDGKYQISYNSTITNGLFAGYLNGSIMPTLAYSKIDLVLPDSLNKVLATFFKDEKPLEISTILYPNKAGKYSIYSPKFNYEEALSGVKVSWGGLKLNVSFNDEFNRFKTNLDVPYFNLSAPTKGDFAINSATYNSSSERSVNDIKVGDASFQLASVKVNLTESDLVNFKLGEIIRTVTGINSVDFLNDIDVINPTQMTLTNAYYKSHSEDVNNYFSADVLAGFESLNSVKSSYGPLELNFALKHIRADKFSAIADLLSYEASLTESERTADKPRMIAELKKLMTPLLIESPVAELNKLTLKVPSGMIAVNGMITTNNFESADMEDQTLFMSKINANVHLSVPKPVLSYLLLMQMKYFLSAGNAELDAQSSQALSQLVNILLENQLKVWLKKGYMTQESDSALSTNIQFESGVIYLNKIPTSMND